MCDELGFYVMLEADQEIHGIAFRNPHTPCDYDCDNEIWLCNKPEWKEQENQEYRQLTEERFRAYYKKFNDLWNETPKEVKMVISNGIRQRSIQEGMEMENITLGDWLSNF